VRVPTEPDLPGNYLPQYSIIKNTISSTEPKLMSLFNDASIGSNIKLSKYFDKIITK
jgi:hypothetical protein